MGDNQEVKSPPQRHLCPLTPHNSPSAITQLEAAASVICMWVVAATGSIVNIISAATITTANNGQQRPTTDAEANHQHDLPTRSANTMQPTKMTVQLPFAQVMMPFLMLVVAMMTVQHHCHQLHATAFSPPLTCRHGPGRTCLSSTVPGADIEQETEDLQPTMPDSAQLAARGKVNEIDFCIAPADVSLSRAYDLAPRPGDAQQQEPKPVQPTTPKVASLTRALNNASNRAVRRILLARCWPSAEALNLSLRMVAKAQIEARKEMKISGTVNGPKCPVPRPILNILMRRNAGTPKKTRSTPKAGETPMPKPRSRTDAEYVADQLASFRGKYGQIPGYECAEAYLDTILCLATTGEESARVKEVIDLKVYDESYRKVKSVLQSVGAKFEENPDTGRLCILEKLEDQDICLSMLDKISLSKESTHPGNSNGVTKMNTVAAPAVPANGAQEAAGTDGADDAADSSSKSEEQEEDEEAPKSKKRRLPRIQFWKRREPPTEEEIMIDEKEQEEQTPLKPTDLGGVILSAEEPTMTRQLNALSNIVKRALLFGGDEELIVLSETLDANKAPFIDRWYPGTSAAADVTTTDGEVERETRPGVQYLDALIMLLRECYDEGVVTTLDPLVPVSPSYSNGYERLMASLVELGSGYVRVSAASVMTMPKPRTATEELGRFAVWESYFRQQNGEVSSSYPTDLEGSWIVEDEVGGEVIGVSTVILEPQGQVNVEPPMQGLRWRLDPGPTHLDTCTFQVLGTDGTVLQYRGFVDRGARLEARFSKRSIQIRGSVMFQMRDGEIATGAADDYWRDMLPVNYKTGTTKFVMKKDKTKETASEA